jgi:SEC-C motif-containing protein
MYVSPKLSSIKDCPCGSQKPFAECCARFLIQQQQAKTPEQLMRSRFCAYYLGGFGDYLLATWFPPTAKGLTALELSKKDHDWQSLELLHKSQKGHSN